MSTLTYLITSEPTSFSTSIYDSDAISNLVLMENLVGTLVKYGGTGRYEPYLAEKWNVSKDGLVWTFSMRHGLRTESGKVIDAVSYVQGLCLALAGLAKRHRLVPVFDTLFGWQEFTENRRSCPNGISIIDTDHLSFTFSRYPEGFLEYLSMPYYGFYEASEFDENLEWKNNKSIFSSGPYRLINLKGTEARLEKRGEWFSNNKNSPDQVIVKHGDSSEITNLKNHLIVAKKLTENETIPNGLRLVLGTPTILNAIVLSPNKAAFRSQDTRAKFRAAILESRKHFALKTLNSTPTETFYPRANTRIQETPQNKAQRKETRLENEQISVVVSSTLTSSEQNYVQNLIGEAAKTLGFHPLFSTENRTKPNWMAEQQGNRKYDIRVVRVDIGGNIENWGIKMMFCSSLGVSFPDPNGSICNLTKKYENQTDSIEKYGEEFEESIAKDGVVIPLWHSSLTWLFSEDLSLEHVSGTMTVPRFDLIQIR